MHLTVVGFSVAAECVVQSRHVNQERPGVGLTLEEITSHLDNSNVKLLEKESQFWSCVDGRSLEGIFLYLATDTKGVLGTPGGDIGEFIASLAVFANQGGTVESDQDILNLFKAFTITQGKDRPFYMHTDADALKRLKEDGNKIVSGFDPKNVSKEHQEEVLSIVIKFQFHFRSHSKA